MKPEKTLQDHFRIIQNLLLIGFVIILSAILFQHTALVMILWGLGFLVMIAGVLYAAKHFRCPHCEAKLDSRRNVPKFCPNCGKKLD